MSKNKQYLNFLFFVSIFLLIGCEEDMNKLTAQELLNKAQHNYEEFAYKDAERFLEKFEERFSEHGEIPNVLYKRALVSYRSGDYKKASILFEKFLEKYPSHQHASQAQEYLRDCNEMQRQYDLESHKQHLISGREFASNPKQVVIKKIDDKNK